METGGLLMAQLFQLLVGSLIFGSIYSLASLGMMLIFNASGVVNFAFGALGTVVAFIYWEGLQRGGAVLGWLLAVIGGALLGWLCYFFVLQRVRRDDGVSSLVATIGLLLASLGVMGAVWGYAPKKVGALASTSALNVLGVSITAIEVTDTVIAIAAVGSISAVLLRTRLGQAVRAVGRDPEVAELMGISSQRIVGMAWAAGTVLTGVAGIMGASTLGLAPNMLDNSVLFAFAGAIIGGFGSLKGCLVGGLAVGFISSLVSGYLSSPLQVPVVFALLIAVLFVRPNGMFGRAETVRA